MMLLWQWRWLAWCGDGKGQHNDAVMAMVMVEDQRNDAVTAMATAGMAW
jgi:hypothetical protein